MNPPDNTVVIFGDDETRIQALDGTQPVFPLSVLEKGNHFINSRLDSSSLSSLLKAEG